MLPALQVCIEPYLIGDGAFPVESYLLPCYDDNQCAAAGQLGSLRRGWNGRQKTSRNCVERTFGILKGRCRSLLCLDMQLDRFTPHIKACVALHNILIDFREEFDDRLLVVDDDEGAGGAAVQGAAAAGAVAPSGDAMRMAMAGKFISGAGGVWGRA